MRKYDNFCASLTNLKELFNYEEPYDKVVLTGLVGLYEICFEQAWKMLKEILQLNGYYEGTSGSPRMILKTAFEAGLINDDVIWLEALQERNNVAHSYNEMIALGIVRSTKDKFYHMFVELKKEVDKNWLGINQASIDQNV